VRVSLRVSAVMTGTVRQQALPDYWDSGRPLLTLLGSLHQLAGRSGRCRESCATPCGRPHRSRNPVRPHGGLRSASRCKEDEESYGQTQPERPWLRNAADNYERRRQSLQGDSLPSVGGENDDRLGIDIISLCDIAHISPRKVARGCARRLLSLRSSVWIFLRSRPRRGPSSRASRTGTDQRVRGHQRLQLVHGQPRCASVNDAMAVGADEREVGKLRTAAFLELG